MAIGDDATAAGFDLVASTDDRRDGWQEINKSRDYAAQAKAAADGKAAASHTHAAGDINSGTLSSARIPNLNASKITAGTIDEARLPNDLEANGPTDSAYARSATGSSWYQVWMNSDNQFMRNTSSRRYKKNIATMTDALAKILKLRPVTYVPKSNPDMASIGLIAEEVFEVFPEVVPLENGRPEAVNYEFLVAPLIGAVQELTARVAQLEAEKEARS